MLNTTPTPILDLLKNLNLVGDFWLVGGCVRDSLLGRTPKDFDMVTTTPEAMDSLGLPRIGKDFPVWQIRVEDHTVEIAAARTEHKVAPGHGGFKIVLTSNLHEDLLRRDLTINTFAWRESDGYLCVPGARSDLQAKRLAHVSQAFGEDPLRVFRVARFAAQLGWEVAPETLELMFSIKPTLQTLSKDRVREELSKALRSPHPESFFKTLAAAGCLWPWFPEVHSLMGIPHSLEHHPEGDAYEHTMWVLRKAKELGATEEVLLSCLGHDFGKAHTDPELWPKHINHETLGIDPIKEFCKRLGFGTQIENTMVKVCRLHMIVHSGRNLRPSTLRDIVLQANRTAIGIDGFGLACQADHCGRGGHWDDEYPTRQLLKDVYTAIRSVVVDPSWNVQRIEQQQIMAIKRMMLGIAA